MPFWALALLFVATTVLMLAFMPRPPAQQAPPDALEEEFEGPDTKEGKSIPVIFGTRNIYPSVIWYGDVETHAIMSDDSDEEKDSEWWNPLSW